MRTPALLSLLVLPFLLSVLAQNNSQSSSQSQQVQLSTYTTVSQTTFFGSGRVLTTSAQTIVVTVTNSASSPTASGNSTSSSQNSTTSASSTTVNSPLPTAPTNIDGGDQNAPVPGGSAPGGIYGPPDSYTAAAFVLKRNALLVSLAGVVIGGVLVLL